MRKFLAITIVTAFFIGCLAGISHAENKFVEFWRKVFKYPAGVARESVEVSTDAAKNATRTVGKTTEATARTITGDVEKAKDMVVEPVKGTGETAYEATKGTVTLPVEAAKDE
jgi:hypothetical protein